MRFSSVLPSADCARHGRWSGAGSTAELKLVAPDGGEEQLPSKLPHRRIQKGERFVCAGPAGGGYGDPRERAREAVFADLEDGLITPDEAETLYGLKAG